VECQLSKVRARLKRHHSEDRRYQQLYSALEEQITDMQEIINSSDEFTVEQFDRWKGIEQDFSQMLEEIGLNQGMFYQINHSL
jgi:hypothetical protein